MVNNKPVIPAKAGIHILTALLLLAAANPAHAEIRESPDSYYKRLMKSCEYNPRASLYDYLLYAAKNRTDQCCADSVKEMARRGAMLAPPNRKCPDGYQVNALRCTTSKQWCEEIR